jgi:hypothetical protein
VVEAYRRPLSWLRGIPADTWRTGLFALCSVSAQVANGELASRSLARCAAWRVTDRHGGIHADSFVLKLKWRLTIRSCSWTTGPGRVWPAGRWACLANWRRLDLASWTRARGPWACERAEMAREGSARWWREVESGMLGHCGVLGASASRSSASSEPPAWRRDTRRISGGAIVRRPEGVVFGDLIW